ncbi:Uncharacterised protein [Mycobacteroides abscessus subsp. abscessus]|uniref:hypothetical protein n=1 Tax=Mycobacteroides abscessus TaxID=36809 RepID=UPI0009A63A32|nr:hypothetical protein [Mycobacteroides abscessus]SLI01147.1 Uncharacterised protein [Mycobacteroides abscessus subsp. abscessus]
MSTTVATMLPSAVTNAKVAVIMAANETIQAQSFNPFTNWKAAVISLGGVMAITMIVGGGFWTMFKLREGIGEAILFQIGLIVVGVIMGLSVGIAAAVIDWSVDQGIVDRKFVHTDEWTSMGVHTITTVNGYAVMVELPRSAFVERSF